MFDADLRTAYVLLGEAATVAGSPIAAIFDTGYAEAFDASGVTPSLRCITADVAGVAVGATVIHDGVTYTVRNVMPLPPDAAETRLMLEQA